MPKISPPLGSRLGFPLALLSLLLAVAPARAQVEQLPVSTNRPELRVAGGMLDPYLAPSERPAASPRPTATLPADTWPTAAWPENALPAKDLQGDVSIIPTDRSPADTWPGVVPGLEITRTLSSEIAPAGYEALGGKSVVESAAFTSEGEQIYPYDMDALPEPFLNGPAVIQPRREGVFQESTNQFDYMMKNDMGQMSYTMSSLYGVPAPTRESPLLIKPLFQIMWLDGPTVTEMPPRLYEASLQLQWLKQINERWGMAISITPGLYGDYEQINWDTVRIPGYAGLKWSYSPTLAFAAGVIYYDRVDVGWMPVGGVIWTPTPNLIFDFIPPRPRVAWRCWCNGCDDHWLYVAGEFGGGSWQIERNGNIADQVAIRDFRLFLGHELKRNGWSLGRLEFGYVFGREIDYASSLPDVQLGDSFIVRSVTIF